MFYLNFKGVDDSGLPNNDSASFTPWVYLSVSPPVSGVEEIVADYRAIGFTPGRHPVVLLRGRFAFDRLQPVEQLATLRSGKLARACGPRLVTVGQRPGTANGVLFMTLEDETGQVNVILWARPKAKHGERAPARESKHTSVINATRRRDSHRAHRRVESRATLNERPDIGST